MKSMRKDKDSVGVLAWAGWEGESVEKM